MNKCLFIGRLGRDNELRYTPSGKAVLNNSLAVDETWKDSQTGEKKTRTTWVRLTFWGKSAEIFAQYTGKGSQVFIEGRLRIDKNEDNGQTKYWTSVSVDEFKFLDYRKGQEGAALPQTQAASAPAGAAAAGLPAPSAAELPGNWDVDPAAFPDDMPGAAALPAAASLPTQEATVDESVPEEMPW